MNSKNNILSAVRGLGSKLLAMAAVVLLAPSCSEDVMGDLDVPGDTGNVTIRLSSLPVGSRATENDDFGKENLMKDALICIFKVGESADTNHPVFMQTVDVSARTQKTVTLQISKDKIDEIFPEGVDNAIIHVFANLKDAGVNVPADPTLGELEALAVTSPFESSLEPSSFVMNGDSELTINRNVDNTSKDEVEGTVRLKRSAAKISLNVRVKDSVTDLAGREWKPVLNGNGMQVYITNGVKSSAVTPSLHTLTTSDYYYTSASSPDNQKGRAFTKNADEDEEKGYPYRLNSPFYTYPNQWTDESETMTFMTLLVPWVCEKEGSYRSCYYMVPVIRDKDTDTDTDANTYSIARNVSYRVCINIDILGNSKPDDPLVIEDASYRAVPWGTESFDVAIKDYRYLVIDNNTYTMNNEGLINIPFYSSHETVIKYEDDVLNYYLFNTTAAGIEKEMSISNTQRNNSTTTNTTIPSYADIPGYREQFGTTKNIYNDWIDNNVDPATNTRSLYFQHELYQWNAYSGTNPVSYGPYEETTTGWGWNQTTVSAEANANSNLSTITRYQLPATLTAAYSRYRMTITIVHKDKLGKPDEAQFSEKIVIWQYPAMYIESTQNFYSTTSADNTGARGNVWVNGNQTTNNTDWCTVRGLQGSNKNPNQYIINITTFSNTSYVIGDPRVTTPDNLDSNFTGNSPANGWASAPAITDGTNGNVDNVATSKYRKLSYYYPTDKSNNKKYTVAPIFRIASSYGVCGNAISYEGAQRRCASYQELDYPAGRWRIPTVGELEFILKLSEDKKIPTLFNSGSTYWTAQGRVTTTLNNGVLTAPTSVNTNQTAFVRCVYDEWFWEGSTIKTTKTQTYGGETFYKYPFVWGDMQR